jgi:Fe-S oxidoreductase
MLFEMLEGNPVKGGWKSEAVKESLDLCLSCKGCKSDCPVQVDMATYKAEFLSHYFEGRLRPRHAYAFGLIHVWSRLAAWMPGVVNLLTQTPGLRSLAKLLSGMEQKRRIPVFAPYTFKQWFQNRAKQKGEKPQPTDAPKVILWPDTFNDHFHPTTAQAAVEVLEAAGFEVDVPMQDMCCGRPLYDYGFLDMAERWLKHILNTLKDDIEDGTPVVVLEPSCAAVFRDELVNLFPQDENAKRLSQQTYLLSEFLTKKAPHYQPPQLKRKALVHGHCHHKALMKMTAEEALLKQMGVEYQMPDTGCCGMAGAFGFEEGEHYDVSIKCGERALIPSVRQAEKETLIVANGFSCREQIEQTTDRQALHLAQVMQMAINEGEQGTPGELPEKKYVKAPTPAGYVIKTALMVTAGALLIGGAVAWSLAAKKRNTT